MPVLQGGSQRCRPHQMLPRVLFELPANSLRNSATQVSQVQRHIRSERFSPHLLGVVEIARSRGKSFEMPAGEEFRDAQRTIYRATHESEQLPTVQAISNRNPKREYVRLRRVPQKLLTGEGPNLFKQQKLSAYIRHCIRNS